jgi:hypothetical protein
VKTNRVATKRPTFSGAHSGGGARSIAWSIQKIFGRPGIKMKWAVAGVTPEICERSGDQWVSENKNGESGPVIPSQKLDLKDLTSDVVTLNWINSMMLFIYPDMCQHTGCATHYRGMISL